MQDKLYEIRNLTRVVGARRGTNLREFMSLYNTPVYFEHCRGGVEVNFLYLKIEDEYVNISLSGWVNKISIDFGWKYINSIKVLQSRRYDQTTLYLDLTTVVKQEMVVCEESDSFVKRKVNKNKYYSRLEDKMKSASHLSDLTVRRANSGTKGFHLKRGFTKNA